MNRGYFCCVHTEATCCSMVLLPLGVHMIFTCMNHAHVCHAGGLDVNIITSRAAGAHNGLTPLRSRLVNGSYSIHSAYIFTHCTLYTYGIIHMVRLGGARVHLWDFFLFLSLTKISIIAQVYICLHTASHIPYMAIQVQPPHLPHFNRYCVFADI